MSIIHLIWTYAVFKLSIQTDALSNSVDPDQTSQNGMADQDLQSLSLILHLFFVLFFCFVLFVLLFVCFFDTSAGNKMDMFKF